MFVTQFLSHWFYLCLLALFTANFSFASQPKVNSNTVQEVASRDVAASNQNQSDTALKPLDPTIRGSLCVVRSDDRILLVHEIITGKWSLPGGTIENNEDPRLTAQRETWEEAGLVVDVGQELGRTGKAVFYECHVESAIIAYEASSYTNGLELPIYFAPHFGVEVRSASLVQLKRFRLASIVILVSGH